MTVQSDICVVGNGVIGKVAALGCAQAGYSVTLLTPSDPAQVAATDGWDVRVYALNQVAHDLLSSLRVWNALNATRIALVDAMVIHGDGERQAGELRFDAYGARVDALAWIVEDRNLNQALDAALQFAPNVRIVSGRATALHQGLERASVALDNDEVLEAALVVGADGGHSWVRGQCEIDLDYRPYHQQAVVANFECTEPHHGVAAQWFTSTEGVIALLPLAGKRVSLVWSAPDALAEVLMREPLAMLAERLSRLPTQKLGTLSPLLPENVKALPLALIRPHAMTAPRVALVGDAAHVVHPLAGHGMNLGFADVAVLLRVMAARGPGRDCGDARVLANYARRRKEEVLAMLIATDGLERLFAAEFEPLRMARNLGLNLVNHLPVIKRKLIGHALGRPI
ncbi:MAG: putative Ubiquinone biosynthesis hydroxylase VisC [Herminiimonas sp.]|nr:putative Ubiquinone biosynthesis hydroxylase VisC [Herminiimonas sp.]MDB5854340.1 putative Ubiquinone biosynthesis hydroxylase VisC [Herminiimonas sp.]